MSGQRRLSNSLYQDGEAVHCSACGHDLGPSKRPWKQAAVLRETPMSALQGPYALSRDAVLREFCCPGCGTVLDAETALPGDPFLVDEVF